MQGDGRRWQLQIRWLMAMIFFIAAAVGAVVSPLDNLALAFLLVPVCGFLLIAAYIQLLVVPYLLAIRLIRCPACGERRLTCLYLALYFLPLQAIHQCLGCGSRFQRWFFGRWLELGPDDDRSPEPSTVA